MKLLKKPHGCWSMFLFILEHMRCVKGLLKNVYNPLIFIPDHLKTQEICEKAAEKKLYQLGDFPDHFKIQKMCERAVENEPETLKYVLDPFKTRDM